ncbi:MAG: hypothetical protein Kow0069_17540 [Promethearchaeota archaeon]
MRFVKHSLLRRQRVEAREYQINVVKTCLSSNTLVVLPTALGKTVIAVLAAVKRLEGRERAKVLVLAPTRPLVLQHFRSFQGLVKLPPEDFALLTGPVKADERARRFEQAKLVFSTPQVVKNDLEYGRYALDDVRLLVLDEAHKSRKTYAYIPVAQHYQLTASDPLVLGLTASPGKNYDQIVSLIDAVGFERVEYRDEYDDDVAPYVHDVNVFYERVELPPRYVEILDALDRAFWDFAKVAVGTGGLPPKERYTKMDVLEAAARARSELDSTIVPSEKGRWAKVLKHLHACVSLLHACELLAVEGLEVFKKFVEKVRERAAKGSASAKQIVSHPDFSEVIYACADPEVPPHPKVRRLRKILERIFTEEEDPRVFLFAQFRDTATRLVELLSNYPPELGVKPVRFVGQACRPGDPGLSQDQQREIVDAFAAGAYNVLVATSVAEEGLDLPSVDHVVFWEAVPSEIRLIQRRGRTGRRRRGNCHVLFTQNSLDHVYLHASERREHNMRACLDRLRRYRAQVRQRGAAAFLGSVPLVVKPSSSPAATSTGPGSAQSLRRRAKRRTLRQRFPFLTKVGRWIVHTVENSDGEGISEEELRKLASVEEISPEELLLELKKVGGIVTKRRVGATTYFQMA